MLVTPIAGAIGGGSAIRTTTGATIVSALAVGAAIGIGVITGMRLLARKLSHLPRLNCPEWLLLLLGVFVIPMALPVVTFFLCRVIVLAGLHL